MSRRVAQQCWTNILGLLDSIFETMHHVEGYDVKIATVEQEQQYEALRWWMDLFRRLTLEQITAAYLLAYGRTENEISDGLGIGPHEIRAWLETVPDFQRLLAFWEDDHERGIEGMQKRIIATFAAHKDPMYQAQVMKMTQGQQKGAQDKRRTEQADERLALDRQRFHHEVARDRRMMGMPSGGGPDINLVMKDGDVHIHAPGPDEPPALLEAMREIEAAKELPNPFAREREPADIDLGGDPEDDDGEAEEDDAVEPRSHTGTGDR